MVTEGERALGDFLIALGNAGPVLVFLGKCLRNGEMREGDAMAAIFMLLGPMMIGEMMDRFFPPKK